MPYVSFTVDAVHRSTLHGAALRLTLPYALHCIAALYGAASNRYNRWPIRVISGIGILYL